MLLKTGSQTMLKQHRTQQRMKQHRSTTTGLVVAVQLNGGQRTTTTADIDGSSDDVDTDNFHRAIAPVLFTAQLFGALPIAGIFSAHPADSALRFRWLHPAPICTALIICGGLCEVVIFTARHVNEPADTSNNLDVSTISFYIFQSNILGGMVLMVRLARRWPRLMRLWYRSEAVFVRPPYSNLLTTGGSGGGVWWFWPRSLRWRVRCIAFGWLATALLEHLLYLISSVYGAWAWIQKCPMPPGETFGRRAFGSVWSHYVWLMPPDGRRSFSAWLWLPCEYVKWSMTFCWSFVDVLIMVVSCALARRFDQVGERMEVVGMAVGGRAMPDTFWIEVRSQYLVLVDLVQEVDGAMSSLVLMSCASNLFFICKQLFNSFTDIPNAINAAYFWLSLLFIVVRTMSVLFCAAAVNDASRRPVAVLRNVPAGAAWSLEVQRFSALCYNGDVVALSGRRFFFVTRTLILAFFGTVATYELVLFNELKDQTHVEPTCE